MAIKTFDEIVTAIKARVSDVEFETKAETKISEKTISGGRVKTYYDIPVLVRNEDDSTREGMQGVIVVHDSNGAELYAEEVSPILQDKVVAAPQSGLLARFVALEAAMGSVQIDPKYLDRLGLSYLVFKTVDGTEYVTSTVGGVEITKQTTNN